ncbi:hypothetical protein C9374_007432 [Naegleria lovaniensis]|uniref:RWP-RK domain-containing protein n=1 Tax=Naegleria lovaniensis TaxID=51637 RepID=A0AA88GIM5_NAELO|nr:uncharacterized protein C9374_007432 [Naegleria lovaniensis]KAG2379293.1 hypothetical protein C9374_007432 [Naegleria lovaniensis]
MTQTNSWNGRMPNSNGTTNGARRSIMCYAPSVDQPPRYQQQQLDHSAHASAEHNPTSSSSSISKSGNHSFHVKFHQYGGSHQPNTTTTTATTTDSSSSTPCSSSFYKPRPPDQAEIVPKQTTKTTQQQDSSHNVAKKRLSRSKTMNNNITSTRTTTPPPIDNNNNNNNETSSNSPQKLASEVTSIHAAATNTTSNHHAHVPTTTIPKSSSSSTTTTNIKFHMLEDPMLRANDDHRSNFVRIDEEQIRKVFHLTQRQAASFLGVSLSTLKRRFYEMRDSLKMDKWPTTAASQALNNVNTSSSATTSTTVSSSGKKGSNSKTTSPSQTPPPSSYQAAQQQPMPNMQLHRNESHHSTSNNYYSYSDRIQSQQDPSLMSMQGGGLVNNSTLTSPSAMLSHEMNKHDATSFTNNSYDGGEGMNYNVRFSRGSYPPCEQHPSYHQPQYHSHRNIPSSTSHSFYSNDQVTESTRMSSFSNQGTMTNQAPQIMENPKYSLPKFVNTPPSGMFFENPLNNMFAATFASSTKMRASPSNIDSSLNSCPQQHSYSSALNPPPAHYIPREEHEEHSPIILPSISSTYPESIQHSHYTTLPTQYRELKSGCSSATLESSSHKISKPHKMKSHTNVSPTDEDDHARNGLKSNMSFILNHSVKDPTHLDSEEWNTLMNAFKHR